MDQEEWELCARIARMFYFEDQSKSDIASTLAMSRFKVARLLQIAREEHVVSISLNAYPDALTADASRLAAHLGLASALVVASEPKDSANRAAIAGAAAALLRETVAPGAVLGLAWGRTIVELSRKIDWLPPCTVLPLTGTVSSDIEQSPIDVVRRVAASSDVHGKAIYAPMFASSAEVAAELRSDPSVAEVLALHGRLTTAVVAIGAWDREPPISQLVPLLTEAEITGLRHEGAVAEVVGTFLRADGSLVETTAAGRGLFVSPQDLRRTPLVLAVAGGMEKVAAIAAVARSGLVTSLVTDERTAEALLAVDGAEEGRGLRATGRTDATRTDDGVAPTVSDMARPDRHQPRAASGTARP